MGTFAFPRDWGRMLTAMVTPFSDDGSLNLAEARRIAAYLVDDQGNDGLVVAGTTGESPTLSHDEKQAILRAVVAEVGDRAAVIFGAGTNDTAESIDLSQMAETEGAHGVMLVNPFYNRPGQAGLAAHFETVARATALPVMLYNIQPRSAINLETPTLLGLAQQPNIVAVKEASGNMAQIAEVCASVPEGFRVYSGDDGITLPILSVGGHGVVSVAAHVLGKPIKEMVSAYFDGDVVRARRLHQRTLPGIQALFKQPSPAPVKAALARLGFQTDRLRLPMVAIDSQETERLMATLAECGVQPLSAALT